MSDDAATGGAAVPDDGSGGGDATDADDDAMADHADASGRLEAVLETVRRFAMRDFSHQAPVAGRGDLPDALAAGVNLLGRELDTLRNEMEARVADRTERLSDLVALLEAEAAERRRTEQALKASNEQLRAWVAELERLYREMSRLSDMNSLLQVCQTREEAYSALARACGELFDDAVGVVYVHDAPRSPLSAVTRWGADAPTDGEIEAGDCWALRRGRLHHSPQGRGRARCRHLGADRRAAWCAPLAGRGDLIGLLHLRCADDLGDAAARQRREQLVGAVAEQISLAIANLELRAALEVQSVRDPLTGLYNRRFFEEALRREIGRGRRAGTPVSVLMADVDRFKLVNDSYGHVAGDLVLREVATTVAATTRSEDVVCRYGGEELAVVMAETTAEVAAERAEAMLRDVRSLPLTWRGTRLPRVTMSVGVATLPTHGATADDVVEAADRALYRAKGAGRDRVLVAGG